jgi:hypothetical protein
MTAVVVFAFVAALHVFVFAPRVIAQENPAQESPQLAEIRSLLREAAKLVPQIEPDQRSSAAANVARLQVMSGDIDGALATTQAPPGRPPDQGAVEIMASALVWRGNMPQAFSMIDDRMQGRAKASAYLMVAGQLAAKGDFPGALTTARLILADDQQRGVYVDTLMRIYWSQWKADDRAGARQTLSEAVAMADKEAKTPSNSKSAISERYRDIASWLDQTGNSAEALPFVARIQKLIDQEEDVSQRSLLLPDLAFAEVYAGEYSAAVRTADALPSANDQDFVLDAIATKRAAQGDTEGGLEMQNRVSNSSLRRGYVEFAADRLAESNRYDRALALVDTIPETQDRAYVLASLALQQAQREDPNARFTVQLAWTTALEAKPEADHDVLEFIAVARGFLGDFSGALEIVDGMDAKSRVWPLWNLT